MANCTNSLGRRSSPSAPNICEITVLFGPDKTKTVPTSLPRLANAAGKGSRFRATPNYPTTYCCLFLVTSLKRKRKPAQRCIQKSYGSQTRGGSNCTLVLAHRKQFSVRFLAQTCKSGHYSSSSLTCAIAMASSPARRLSRSSSSNSASRSRLRNKRISMGTHGR